MQISVVIPTCNRRDRLLLLLQNLDQVNFPITEVIIVDSGEQILCAADYDHFSNLVIIYLQSEKSVCIQRNIGIKEARGEWIFLCDDDIEVPLDYLQKISGHAVLHPDAGAISGLVLQKENDMWTATYPIESALQLCWKFMFQLSIWGEIRCKRKSLLTNKIETFYRRKGNHISKAGWPVITDFSGEYMLCPVYGLGASVVRKKWLMGSLYPRSFGPPWYRRQLRSCHQFPWKNPCANRSFGIPSPGTSKSSPTAITIFPASFGVRLFHENEPELAFCQKNVVALVARRKLAAIYLRKGPRDDRTSVPDYYDNCFRKKSLL